MQENQRSIQQGGELAERFAQVLAGTATKEESVAKK
jgi:hypothetical protein